MKQLRGLSGAAGRHRGLEIRVDTLDRNAASDLFIFNQTKTSFNIKITRRGKQLKTSMLLTFIHNLSILRQDNDFNMQTLS